LTEGNCTNASKTLLLAPSGFNPVELSLHSQQQMPAIMESLAEIPLTRNLESIAVTTHISIIQKFKITPA
jgi:hypothetical protein